MLLRSKRKYDGNEICLTKRQRLTRSQNAEEHNTTSPFYLLPRELRDEIYEHAWGNVGIVFQYRGIWSVAAPKNGEDFAIGLPKWIRTSKLILDEAMQAFSRTRIFGPQFRYGVPRCLNVSWGPPAPQKVHDKKHTLLMSGRIRKVAWDICMVLDGKRSEGVLQTSHDSGLFAESLATLDVRNIHLQLFWDYDRTLGRPRGSPKMEALYGRCRKASVRLRLVYASRNAGGREMESILEEMVDVAARYAKDLVGGDDVRLDTGVLMVRKEVSRFAPGLIVCERVVVAERRVGG
ncbi:hypothetical protein BU26DRAFT_25143 [Trematosphaeria pertusa]|uniref:Uncharacterized protein n=1 Tax=Trematosphaeria pertusa TaxID=390896 RepID=A0A6A6J2L1_9PLEO|nr:uncharacterized protein BU26DRAFT_25143 [Trematosphaeria pertusa]KAF2256587.1 hypothetical protein BU26DRAFT_25143 [Trematosphaeria pertusa]